MKSSLLMACLVLLAAVPTAANPVDTETVEAMQRLAEEIVEDKSCSDPEQMVEYFGRYGLSRNLFGEDLHRAFHDEFELFAPYMLAAQWVDYCIDGEIQDLFRERSDEELGALMLANLREWLVADIELAPPDGTMRIMGPEEFVKEAIDRMRVAAAEELALWQDCDAKPWFDRLLAREDLDPEHRRLVRIARMRLEDPTSCRFFEVSEEWEGPPRFLKTRSDVVRGRNVNLMRTVDPEDRPDRELGDEEIDRIWALLDRAVFVERFDFAQDDEVVLEFAGGGRVGLSFYGGDQVVATDRSSIRRVAAAAYRSPEIFAILESLAREWRP